VSVSEPLVADVEDDRPPICPGCGVTMFVISGEDAEAHEVCVECGFADEAA
jgi:hypothetical protein